MLFQRPTSAAATSSGVTAVSVTTKPGGATGSGNVPTTPTRKIAVSWGYELSN